MSVEGIGLGTGPRVPEDMQQGAFMSLAILSFKFGKYQLLKR